MTLHVMVGNQAKLVVSNSVDPQLYKPQNVNQNDKAKIRAKYGIPDGGNMILFIGRLTWVKGVRNLIQAIPMVFKEYPKTCNFGQRIEEQNDITETSERLNIKDKVVYRLDFVLEEERILHYAAADLCVFPSVYEPFGIVSLEAMTLWLNPSWSVHAT